MPRIAARLIALLFAVIFVFPADASEAAPGPVVIAPADLRSFAPEGTFLDEGAPSVATQTSYQSANIHIRITHLRDADTRSDVTVADVYVASVEYLRRGFPLGKWDGEMRSIKTIAPDHGAILAMTGDYAALLEAGLVVANGEVLRDTPNNVRDNCLILKDGQMVTYPRRVMEIDAALEMGVWHSFLFGPALLNDGAAVEKFDSKLSGQNPRSVLGYVAPGHYVFVTVDGRSNKSRGMTLPELSRFMHGLGCETAYNLDGGQSALMWFNGEIINVPYNGGRRLMDIVYVGEAPAE